MFFYDLLCFLRTLTPSFVPRVVRACRPGWVLPVRHWGRHLLWLYGSRHGTFADSCCLDNQQTMAGHRCRLPVTVLKLENWSSWRPKIGKPISFCSWEQKEYPYLYIEAEERLEAFLVCTFTGDPSSSFCFFYKQAYKWRYNKKYRTSKLFLQIADTRANNSLILCVDCGKTVFMYVFALYLYYFLKYVPWECILL